MCVGVVFLFFRTKIVYQSRRDVEGDKRRYDEVWAELITQEASYRSLEHLSQLAKSVRQTKNIEQTVRGQDRVHDSLFEPDTHAFSPPFLLLRNQFSALWRVREEEEEAGRRIASLDQLYAQAALIEEPFRAKVVELARGSGGLFVLNSSGQVHDPHVTLVSMEEAEAQDAVKDVKFAKLKGVDRAIEKLSRSYNCNVYLLVDVVRQCIVFDSVDSLWACLQAIIEDPELEIIRIKNRLDFEYKAERSAGYRDVAMNVKLHTCESQRLGLTGHVCEIQLVLKEVMMLKTVVGHKRYVVFRNVRCE
eukprot:758034-Hanusia_phi.AAC.1